MWNRVPLVVVLGPTGVGKSKLSLELAKRFAGQIISADSMQVYKGLDVITNKVTEEERAIAPHHMMDFFDPLNNFTVVHFRNTALPIIRGLQASKVLPIVVGGTNYYIESLLWDILVDDEYASLQDRKCDAVTVQADLDDLSSWCNYVADLKKDRFDSLPETVRVDADRLVASMLWCKAALAEGEAALGEASGSNSESSFVKGCEKLRLDIVRMRDEIRELLQRVRVELRLRPDREIRRVQDDINKKLHSKLEDFDPETASITHHNCRRKILRALQIHASNCVRQSELLKAQRSQDGGSPVGGPLRFKDTIMFWIQCKEDVLNKRLDGRVDDMMTKGLVQELLDFHKSYNEIRLRKIDTTSAYTQGIFQSIGFKEFHTYLTLSDDDQDTERGRKLLAEGVDALKAVTRRYSRKQNKWIRNRFIRAKDREVPAIYGLDATDLESWEENVLKPAVDILGSHLGVEGHATDRLPLPREDPINSAVKANHCKICDRVFMDALQWSAHLTSKKHKRMAVKRMKNLSVEEVSDRKEDVDPAQERS